MHGAVTESMDVTWSYITDSLQNVKSLKIFKDFVVQGQGFVNWDYNTGYVMVAVMSADISLRETQLFDINLVLNYQLEKTQRNIFWQATTHKHSRQRYRN